MKRLLALLALASLPFSVLGQVTLNATPSPGITTVTVDVSPNLRSGQRLQIFNGGLLVFDITPSGGIELNQMRAYLWPQAGRLRAVLSGGRDEISEIQLAHDGRSVNWSARSLDERDVQLRANTLSGGSGAQIVLKADASPDKYVGEVRMLTSLGSLTMGLAPNTAFRQVINMRGVFGERATATHVIKYGHEPASGQTGAAAAPTAMTTSPRPATGQRPANQVEQTSYMPDEDRLRASLHWRCYGQFRVDAPLYFDYLMGRPGKGPGYGTMMQDQPPQIRQRLLKDQGERVKRLLAGVYRPPTTVYSSHTAEYQQRMKDLQAKRDNESLERNVRIYAASLVSGAGTVAEDGLEAIQLLRQAVDRAGGDAQQETQCMLTYLEDRFTDKPDDQIQAAYEDMLARGAQSQSHYTCTLGVNLALGYLNRGNPREARRVVNQVLPYTNPPFFSKATDPYPRRDCQMVHWLDGNMNYLGLGTPRNLKAAGESFRTCSGMLDTCAFDYAVMILAGEANSGDKVDAIRLLNRVSQSQDVVLRGKADELLNRYTTNASRLLAMLPKETLPVMAIGAASMLACSQSAACTAFMDGFGKSLSASLANRCQGQGQSILRAPRWGGDAMSVIDMDAAISNIASGCWD